MRTDNESDYLDEDPPIPGQEWSLVSVITPATVKTAESFNWKEKTTSGKDWDLRLLKVRVNCKTSELEKWKAYFDKIDPDTPLFQLNVGRWGAFDDGDDFCDDIVSQNEKANEMMRSLKENQAKAKQYEEKRIIDAKKENERRRKLLRKKEKAQEEKAKRILQETDIILSNEILDENVKSLNNLSIEELRQKSIALDETIAREQILKDGRDRQQKEEEQRQKDQESEPVEIPTFDDENIILEEKVNEVKQIDENLEQTEEQLQKQKEILSSIDAEKRKIQQKIDEIKNKI